MINAHLSEGFVRLVRSGNLTRTLKRRRVPIQAQRNQTLSQMLNLCRFLR